MDDRSSRWKIFTTLLVLTSLTALAPPGAVGGKEAARGTDEADGFHEDGHDLVHMDVRVVGSPRGEWVVIARGEVHLPAPAAQLTLRSPDARVAPPAGADAGEWRRSLALGSNAGFEERFRVGPAEEGVLLVEFEHDASPHYALRKAVALRVAQGADGPEVRVEPAGVAADPGSGTYYETGTDEGASEGPTPALAPGETWVDATMLFKDQGNTVRACRYCKIEVWDYDDGGLADDRITTTYTNYKGYFGAKFLNSAEEDGTKRDIFFKVYTDSGQARVLDKYSAPYVYRTLIRDSDIANGDVSLGGLTMATSGTLAGAFYLHRSLATAWNTLNSYVGVDVSMVVARYPVETHPTPHAHDAETAHYHPGGEIHIGSAQVTGDIHAHEYGHHVMYWAYGNQYPAGSCPSPHYLNGHSGYACAWQEGWANYIALIAWGSARFTFSSGTYYDFESWDPFESGADVELRVAGTLWDLTDTPADGYDNVDYTFSTVWTAFRYNGGDDTTLCAYYANWKALGYSQTNFVNAARQNRIYTSSYNAFTC